MAIAFTTDNLQAIVTLKRAALSALRAAQKIEPAGKTILRELPNEWEDPVWQEYVQGAFEDVSKLLGMSPTIRFLDLPAIVADTMVSQMLGTVDDTGHLRGFLSADPQLVALAARNAVPTRSVGLPTLLGLVTAGGLGAFFLGRYIMSR